MGPLYTVAKGLSGIAAENTHVMEKKKTASNRGLYPSHTQINSLTYMPSPSIQTCSYNVWRANSAGESFVFWRRSVRQPSQFNDWRGFLLKPECRRPRNRSAHHDIKPNCRPGSPLSFYRRHCSCCHDGWATALLTTHFRSVLKKSSSF